MHAFAPGVAEKFGFYVYLLIDPRNGVVFYVGKGTGSRCFAYLAEARTTRADTVGDYAKLARIREIESVGAAIQIELLRHGLSEGEALLVESVAIDLLGLQDLRIGLAATRPSRAAVCRPLTSMRCTEPGPSRSTPHIESS
jgi:uncharacterized protein